jgi:3-oxoacyl-[acyl-carrier protein] reductase
LIEQELLMMAAVRRPDDFSRKKEFQMRRILITGAAGGLGRDMIARLSKDDWSFILVDMSEKIHALPSEFGLEPDRAFTRQCDLADRVSLETLCDEISGGELACDALVNNAGISSYGKDGQKLTIDQIDHDELLHILGVNLVAPFFLSKAALPNMRDKGWGRIVNIASRGGRTFSEVFPSSFSASKSGLIGLSRSIAGEAGPFGVTSNVIAPGVIVTPQVGKVDPSLLANAKIPAGRYGAPNEISGAVAFLVSEDGGFTNGAIIDVNGGAFMPS